ASQPNAGQACSPQEKLAAFKSCVDTYGHRGQASSPQLSAFSSRGWLELIMLSANLASPYSCPIPALFETPHE
ncbi:hypothetical protein, partial [Pseudomonas sp. Leaf98]|uniref:hypothetical protein n=1 Tax=Pseudomonas sp. Leaf98 TaxID=2201171 RepID=UPI001C49C09A